MGKARSSSAIGKLFGVPQVIAPPTIRNLPVKVRTKSRSTALPAAVHLSHLSFFCLAHLARAAFLALALLSSGLNLAARLFPPFEPPIFPNATA
jgi:hypothetical protein